METPAKQKVTVTLPAETVRALDAQARAAGGSRSAVVARALNEWQQHLASAPAISAPHEAEDAARLHADTAAFYQAQSSDEQAEDDAWASHASAAAPAAWDTP